MGIQYLWVLIRRDTEGTMPTNEQIQTVRAALDGLHERFGVESDYQLVKKLREHGLMTSYPTLWKWRNGRWTDGDLVLVAALTNSPIQPSQS